MPRWTPESRLKQASAIRGWMPWTLSTGPVTAEGNARVARNGWKGRIRANVSNWHRSVSQIVLNVEKLYSLVRPKRKMGRKVDPAPAAAVWNASEDWDDDQDDEEEIDAFDKMSPAEVQAALRRIMAGREALGSALKRNRQSVKCGLRFARCSFLPLP